MPRPPRNPAQPTPSPSPSPAAASVMPTGSSSGPLPPAVAEATEHFMVPLGSLGYRRSGDFIQHDFIPTLNGRAAAQAYFEIGENDPLLGGVLFALEMLLRRVHWKIDPPQGAEENATAKAAASVARRMLFEDLDRPWPEVVADISSMFQYGFAPLEITMAMAEPSDTRAPDGAAKPGTLVVKSLDLRAQTSIVRYDVEPESGQLRGIWQQDTARPSIGEVYIPRTKLAYFRTTPRSGSPEGRSLLRRAYTTWKRNQVMLEAEARAALRRSGFVLARVPNEILRSDASVEHRQRLAQIRSVVENVAADRQGAVIIPGDVDPDTKQPLYSIEYVVADANQAADMSPIIERGDARMAGSVLADFMLLGQQATGSFALSSDKTALFIEALQGFVDSIAEEVNRSVLTRWWALRGEDPAIRPRLSGGDIGPTDLAAFGGFLTQLLGAGAIQADEPLEQHVRAVAKLPKPDAATRRASPKAAAEAAAAETMQASTSRRTKAAAKRGAMEGAQSGAAQRARGAR